MPAKNRVLGSPPIAVSVGVQVYHGGNPDRNPDRIKRSAPGLFEDPEAVELSRPGSRRLSLESSTDIMDIMDRLLEMSLNRQSNH